MKDPDSGVAIFFLFFTLFDVKRVYDVEKLFFLLI